MDFSGAFNDLTMKSTTTLRIVPPRRVAAGARHAGGLSQLTRQVSDLFYKRGVEVAKVLYKKIDERYPGRETDPEQRKLHALKHNNARDILNEHRNEVVGAVLPNFVVEYRTDDEPGTADEMVFDLIIRNLFYVMCRTFVDNVDDLVAREEVDSTTAILKNVIATQTDMLSREIKNFKFGARPIIAAR